MNARETLLSQGNLKEKEVTLSNGLELLIRELSIEEQDTVREKSLKVGLNENGEMSIDSMKTGTQNVLTVIYSVRDAKTKERVFSMSDFKVLMNKSERSWVSEILEEIGKLSKATVKDVDEAKK